MTEDRYGIERRTKSSVIVLLFITVHLINGSRAERVSANSFQSLAVAVCVPLDEAAARRRRNFPSFPPLHSPSGSVVFVSWFRTPAAADLQAEF